VSVAHGEDGHMVVFEGIKMGSINTTKMFDEMLQ
jgi:hypothetical protein